MRQPPDPTSEILAERCLVPPELAAGIRVWVDARVGVLAAVTGVALVQSFRVVRDNGNKQYLSWGNYAAVAAVAAGEYGVQRLATDAAPASILASQECELRLPYLTRELLPPSGHMSAPGEAIGR